MFIPGHFAAGFLVAKLTLTIFGYQFSPSIELGLFIWGMLSAFMIDFDVFYIMIKAKRFNISADQLDKHRSWTHAFLPHLIAFLAITIINNMTVQTPILNAAATIYLLSTASHLFLDSLFTTMGAKWLWPFDKRFIIFTKISQKDLDRFNAAKENIQNIWLLQLAIYRTTLIGKIEIALIFLALIVAIFSFT